MPETHGSKKVETLITDEIVAGMADEAERGYNVDEILRRQEARRPSTESASVQSLNLDPELTRDRLLRAAKKGISVSELIRRALHRYVTDS